MGAEERAIRKATLRLLPLLVVCYITAYLDRVNIGYAAPSMSRDLGLSSTAYGLAAGLFFITYVTLEVPSNAAVRRFGPGPWFARIMLTWGLASLAMAFVWNEASLYVLRILLGAAEAGFVPGGVYFLTLWFPERVRGRIMGYFFISGAIAGVIGGFVSGHLLDLDGLFGLRGWQLLFIVEALPAIVLAALVYLFLPTTPKDASWLDADEKAALSAAVERSRAPEHDVAGTLAALKTPRVWVLGLIYFGAISINYTVNFFVPVIIKGLGMSNVQTGTLSALPYLLGIVSQVGWARLSDRAGERILFTFSALMLGTAGIVVSALVEDPAWKVGAFIVAGIGVYGSISCFWTLPARLIGGTGAPAGIAAVNALGNVSGLVAPAVIGATRDWTGSYTTGLLIVAGFSTAAAVLLLGFGRRPRPSVASG